MSRKPIPAFQEMNRGVDPEVLADLGYAVPDRYIDSDVTASTEAGRDADLDLLTAEPKSINEQLGRSAVASRESATPRNQHPGPRKRFDRNTGRPASLASLGGRARAFAEVSDSWETK